MTEHISEAPEELVLNRLIRGVITQEAERITGLDSMVKAFGEEGTIQLFGETPGGYVVDLYVRTEHVAEQRVERALVLKREGVSLTTAQIITEAVLIAAARAAANEITEQGDEQYVLSHLYSRGGFTSSPDGRLSINPSCLACVEPHYEKAPKWSLPLDTITTWKIFVESFLRDFHAPFLSFDRLHQEIDDTRNRGPAHITDLIDDICFSPSAPAIPLLITHVFGKKAGAALKRFPVPASQRGRGREKRSDALLSIDEILGDYPPIITTAVMPALARATSETGSVVQDGKDVRIWQEDYEQFPYADYLQDENRELFRFSMRPAKQTPEEAWNLVAQIKDPQALNTALLLILLHLSQCGNDLKKDTTVAIDQILTFKKFKKHKRAHRPENVEAETARIRALSGLQVRIAGQTIWDQAHPGKKTKFNVTSPLWIIERTLSQQEYQDDRPVEAERAIAVKYHLGEWALPFVDGTGRYFTHTIRQLFELEGKAGIATRIGFYLAREFRIRAYKADYLQKISIGDMLANAGIDAGSPGYAHNPKRLRDDVENALIELMRLGFVGSWEYVPDARGNPPARSGKGWGQRWLNSDITVLPSRRTLDKVGVKATSPAAQARLQQVMLALEP